MTATIEQAVTNAVEPRRSRKQPQYDLPTTKGDKLELAPLVSLARISDGETQIQEGQAPLNTTNLRDAATTNVQPSVVDLFCGAGGMSLGFEDAGFRIALGVDMNYWACRTFAAHVPAPVVVQNLEEVTNFRNFFTQHHITEVTGIIGGPPCQGFSRVGKGRIRHQNRLDGHEEHRADPRNGLYRQFVAAVEALRPQFFVMENVPDLDSYEDDEGVLADRIEDLFHDLGYRVERRILRAAQVGVPQKRSRLFFIGLRDDLGLDVRWPDTAAAAAIYGMQSLHTAIGDLPIIASGQVQRELPYENCRTNWLNRWYRKDIPEGQQQLIYDHITRPHRTDDQDYFRLLEEGQRFVDLPEDARRYRSDIFIDKYRKLIWDEPAWTITAHLRRDGYRYIHPQAEPPRTVSVREAARLQSFPDRWRFCGYRSNAFEQIGNAVPPLLSRALARVILAQLTGQPLEPDPLLQPVDPFTTRVQQ